MAWAHRAKATTMCAEVATTCAKTVTMCAKTATICANATTTCAKAATMCADAATLALMDGSMYAEAAFFGRDAKSVARSLKSRRIRSKSVQAPADAAPAH